MRWDATPGKSGMFVMALSDKERKAVPGIAGIFIRWNSTSNDGDALVLAYNTSSMESDWTGPAWGSKIASAVALLNHTDSPDSFVSTIKEFKVDQEKLSLMQNAGMHPLKVAGVL
jgi:formylmethanofuran dehydrogenase subunit E-like metal-binding protein